MLPDYMPPEIFNFEIPVEVQYVDLSAVTLPAAFEAYRKPVSAPEIPGVRQRVDRIEQSLYSIEGTHHFLRTELLPEEVEAVQELRDSRFADWDPLADKDHIHVLVIDGEGVSHYSSNAILRALYPGGYFHHGEIDASIVGSADHVVRSELVEVDLSSPTDFLETLREVNDYIARTGQRPDAINMSLGASRIVPVEAIQFFEDFNDAVASKDQLPATGTLMRELVRLAHNTDGPVFISAGNSGAETYNILALVRAWSDNVVIVGATDQNGDRATYSSDTPDLFVNGDLERFPVCDAEGLDGIVTLPGDHYLDFAEELESYRFVEGRRVSDVLAGQTEVDLLLSAIESGHFSSVAEQLAGVVFDRGDVERLRAQLGRTPALSRLNRLVVFMADGKYVIDAATLFDQAQPLSFREYAPKGISGIYSVENGVLRLSSSCDEDMVMRMQGTSFASPHALKVFIQDYLDSSLGR